MYLFQKIQILYLLTLLIEFNSKSLETLKSDSILRSRFQNESLKEIDIIVKKEEALRERDHQFALALSKMKTPVDAEYSKNFYYMDPVQGEAE